MAEQAEAIEILALEEELRGDGDGAAKGALLEDLGADAKDVKRELDKGLPPAEFERCQQWLGALEASMKVVESVWRRQHG